MNNVNIKFYDKSTIDLLAWPQSEEGQYAKKYLLPLIKDGVKRYFENIDTKMMILKIDEIILPITINHMEYKNSYVCSPWGQYVGLGIDTLKSLKFLMKLYGKLLSWGKINQIVYVNNWLLPTNLYPNLSEQYVNAMTQALKERFPDHVIAFRSINDWEHDHLKKSMTQLNYQFIASRQVFLLDTLDKKSFNSRMFKSDLKILKNTSYKVIETLSNDEIPRIQELYLQLYVDKYSHYNPKFTIPFLQLAQKNHILKFKALKKDDKIDGVVGYFVRNGVMTSPLFGYDMQIPKKEGLYRMISTLLSLEAKEKKVLLNKSSGAASYKKLRRGKGVMEWIAFYDRHLPISRRIPWKVLKTLINKIGIRFMKSDQF